MKVIVFTSSYKRPYMLRQCILNAKNQTYKGFFHTINITSDLEDMQNYLPLLEDVYTLEDMNIMHSVNNHTHFNNIKAIKAVNNYESYDLFIKMDDDDIYKADYVKNIVDAFKTHPYVDIVSSEIKYQLNGNNIHEVNAKDLGGNRDVDYKMPMTYAFNKKALNAIINLQSKDMYGFDDMTWRIIWKAYELKHVVVDNSQQIVWHIHGKNVSTANFLQ
jgi:hypothetical protein